MKYFSFIFIAAITFLFSQTALAQSGGWTEGITTAQNVSGLPVTQAESVLEAVLTWIIGAFIILSFISFVVTGIMYLFASASKDMQERAKTGFTYSIIALAVSFSAFIIIELVNFLMGGESIPFS